MAPKTNFISPTCRKRLQIQGYEQYSDEELNDFKYGIRFAYGLCITTLTIGLSLQSVTILSVMVIVAFVGAFPPYHPFDYLYNYGVRHLLNKPKIPKRTNQGRFACGIASVWLTVSIYLIINNQAVLGNILAVILLSVGVLVTFTDICIPSMIYNRILKMVRS